MRDVCGCRVIRPQGNEPALELPPAYIIGEDSWALGNLTG